MDFVKAAMTSGVSLQGSSDPAIQTRPLSIEHMAVAMPLRFPLLDQAALAVADLQATPIFAGGLRHVLPGSWLLSHPPADQQNLQYVTSFEMMALWVSAGYGVGLSAQSRIKRTMDGESACARWTTVPTRS